MPRKDKSLSDEAIEKMKETKLQNRLAKYDWEIAEPYLDVNMNKGNKNKKNNHITLREFKNQALSGRTNRKMGKEYGRNLIGFYSQFCQGNIKLTKDKFEEEYLSGKKLIEIADKHDISRDYIGYLRRLYQIKRKGAKYINRKQKEKPITDRQRSILLGSLMGDAYKGPGTTSAVKFKHSGSQREYIDWLFMEFKEHVTPRGIVCNPVIDWRSEKKTYAYDFYTHANSDIEKYISMFYDDNKKIVSKKILDQLDELSLAVWYMDDGKSYVKDGYISSMTICTDSFSVSECELIVEWMMSQWNINAYIKMSKGKHPRIKIRSDNISRFISIIESHVIPSMKYKIDSKENIKKKKHRIKFNSVEELNRIPAGKEFNKLSPENRSDLVNEVVDYYHDRGIEFLTQFDWGDNLDKIINYDSTYLQKGNEYKYKHIGNKMLINYFPNFWDANAKGNHSLRGIFENRKYLHEIISSILSAGNNAPTKNKILSKIKWYRGNKSISFMPACVAKSVYEKHCKEGANVLDFCAGWGGRLLGAYANDKVQSYSGCDVSFETYKGLSRLKEDLIDSYGYKDINIQYQDSVTFMSKFNDKYFDFCFTSPPYFDSEIYSNDEQQSINQYPDYSDWFNEFLINSIEEARRVSKKVAINIHSVSGYDIEKDLEKYFDDNDIDFYKEYFVMSSRKKANRKEPIYIVE